MIAATVNVHADFVSMIMIFMYGFMLISLLVAISLSTLFPYPFILYYIISHLQHLGMHMLSLSLSYDIFSIEELKHWFGGFVFFLYVYSIVRILLHCYIGAVVLLQFLL